MIFRRTLEIATYLFLFNKAVADVETPPGGSGGAIQVPDPLKGGGFQDIVKMLVDFMTTIAIPLVAVMVIIGGIQLMTAGGNESNIEKGKKTITYAVIGFVVVLSANAVVLIIRQLFQ